jgi:hypothetical protein
MAVFLDEDMFGRDDNTIGYPHLLLCMGFALRTANELWGVHLTDVKSSALMIPLFWKWAQAKGLNSNTITDMYACCDHKGRYGITSRSAGLKAWTTELQNHASAIGWNGPAHGFDTGIISPQKGTYVEYIHQTKGSQPCDIFYKRDEKTVRGTSNTILSNGGSADVVSWSTFNNKLRGFSNMIGGINGKKSSSHTGKFHKLNYALRLTTIKV